jgi:hypothetical protein
MKKITTFQIIACVIFAFLFATFVFMFFKDSNIEQNQIQPTQTIEPKTTSQTQTTEKQSFICFAKEYKYELEQNGFLNVKISSVLKYIKDKFDDKIFLVKTKIQNEVEIKSFKCNDGSILHVKIKDNLVVGFDFEKI